MRYRYREVVLFVAGLMKDPRPLVQHVYEMQVEDYLNQMRAGAPPLIDTNLFKSLHTESTVQLPHPLHNKYINHYNHMGRGAYTNTTPVYWPSQVYHFKWMRHEVKLADHHTEGEEIPPCVMNIDLHGSSEAVSDSLLSICSQISKHQVITDLYMDSVTCNSLEAPMLINPVVVHLYHCELPYGFVKKILRQLFGCGESLQKLDLSYMNLIPFESLLDELLENLVAHHQSKREAGLAQRKLKLELKGTNLFSWFLKKWRNRCEEVDSINCEDDVKSNVASHKPVTPNISNKVGAEVDHADSDQQTDKDEDENVLAPANLSEQLERWRNKLVAIIPHRFNDDDDENEEWWDNEIAHIGDDESESSSDIDP